MEEVRNCYKGNTAAVNELFTGAVPTPDLFVKAAGAAGRDLTTQAYIKVMEKLHGGPDMFGSSYAFSPTSHQGASSCYIAQIKDGRWVTLPTPVVLTR